MKTAAIVSLKGGAEMTPLALHIATAAQQSGLRTAWLRSELGMVRDRIIV